MTQRAYKFRIEPTAEQRAQLAIDFGHARWTWNKALAWRDGIYKATGESVTGIDFSRELTLLKKLEPYAWLKDANSVVLVQKLRDQDTAFKNFFAGRAKFPKFKKKTHTQRVRYLLDQRRVAGMYRPGDMLKLPRIGALKVRWSRIPGGIPKMVTVIKDANDRYFVSFSVEEQIQCLPQTTKAVGIDVGIKDVFVTSDGAKSGNPRHLGTLLRRKKILGRRLSRKRKGSARWHTMRRKLAKLDAHVAACRADFLHKATTGIIRNNQVIAIEDLNVRGMMANRRLARAIGDVGMHEFRRQLTYKADWHRRELIVIDRWAPTSKACSECGSVQAEMPLKIREWTCPDCGAVHDRDVNAAKNVLTIATGGRSALNNARGAGYIPSAAVQKAAA